MRTHFLLKLVVLVLTSFLAATAQAQLVETTTSVSSSAEPACLGSPVTFTATVISSPPGMGIPTGTVDFRVDDLYLGTAVLDGAGQATLTDGLDAGSHSITAQYSGDLAFSGSISSALSQTINTAPSPALNPVNQAVCSSGTAVFTASANGAPAPQLQWQVSTDNGATFTDIAGATSGTYSFIANTSHNGRQYQARFTNVCGVGVSAAATLTVWARPTATVSGSTTVCRGNSATLQASLTGIAPWTVVWSDGVTNANILASPVTRLVTPTINTVYSITSLSDANCTGTASGSATITVNVSPAATVNPANQAVCPGTPVAFAASSTGTPAPSIQWQVSTDAGATFVSIPGATSATYGFTAAATDNGKQYRALFTNNCGSSASAAASLTVYVVPNCAISGPDIVCANMANQIYTGVAGLAGYRWSISGNGALTGAVNSATVAVNAGASGTFTLSLTVTNANGCTSTCLKTVSIATRPSGVVSGGGTICPGGNATIQATLTGASPWTLVWSDGFTQNVGSSPATRNVSPASSTNYSVTQVMDLNCSGSASGSATVTVNSSPSVTANPLSQAVCPGTSVSLSAAASGSPAPSVQWQVSTDGGATFAAIPGATASTYTFTALNADNSKRYRALFNNTCSSATSSAAMLTVYSVPTCSISGPDAVCATSLNQVYSAPPGLAGYRWSVSGSGTIAGPINAATVAVNAGASGTFTISVSLTNATGCSSTCAKTVTLIPLPTAVVSGGGAICPGNSTTIQAILTGTAPWTLIWSDGFNQPNVLSSPAVRTVSPGSTTNYTVTSVSDANCSNSGSGSASVTINSSPSITSAPVNQAVCAGSPITLAASATGSPAPAAQWQVSTDGGTIFANIAGANSASYTFTAALSDNGKRFRIVFTNVCGTAISPSAALVVNALPSATITADPVICPGSTGNTANVPSAGPGATYRWTISGGTITSGAGTTAIIYTAGAGGSVNLTAAVTNAAGCSASGSFSATLAVQGKNLEGWKNKTPLQWQGSTFNDGDHQYSEGNSIPMRLELSQTCAGGGWCVVLRYDFKDGNTSRHFYDFLGTYNASESTVNGHVLDSFSSYEAPTTFPIPVDPALSYQLPGNFTVYNGVITNVSSYSTISGSTTCKQLTISGFTTPGGGAKDVLILFGGHLARENEWGPGNGASSFPGASAKVQYQFCGASAFANFGVNPAGIVKQADLSITKTAAPNPLCAGNTLIYSLNVQNSGPNQALPVTVLDALPAGTMLSTVSLSQGSWSGSTNLNINLGTINAGSNATISIVVTVDTNRTAGIITNTATVSAGSPADPYMLNNTASATTMVFPHPSATPLIDQVVCRGAPVSFSTVAIGAPPFTYQWVRNGFPIPGATTSSFLIPSVTPIDAGTYCVIVSGQCNNITDVVTNCATLTISADASASSLANQTVCPNDNATFSTTPAGTGPFTFTWKKDGVVIPGATLNSLTVPSVNDASAGAYCVEVAGACSTASSCAVLAVRTNLTATPLLDQTNCIGQNVTFSTLASGTGPFTYLWRKDGITLAGETRSSLNISSITSPHSGIYSVEVMGTCNGVTNSAFLAIKVTTTADPIPALTNCPGTVATFSAIAHGDGPFTYQWAREGAPLAGQTGSSLILSSVTAADAGNYSVQVNGLCGSITNFAHLAINQNSIVATPPANLTRCPGETAAFTVTAGGTGPFTYQWSKDNVLISGETNRTLTLSNVSSTTAGTYSVSIAGACGNPAVTAATLTVNENVTVAGPLQNATNCPGTSARFAVVAGGTGPFTYQWFHSGTPLPGQTSSSLDLSNISAADAGTYSVTISGACGTAVTSSASLIVNQNLIVTSPPASITNCPATSASFAVLASGTGLTYQWYRGATSIPGQTGSALSLASVSAADAGIYSVVVSGVCGNPVTNSASLTVNTPTTTDPLVSVTICPGAPASFTTIAHGTGPFTYQWLKDGSPVSNQTGGSLTLASITAADAGVYSVRVTGACSSAIQSALLTVNTPVTADPIISHTICPGAATSLGTAAHGTGPFTYQWIKDGKLLPGGTTSTWAVPSATVLDNGTYVVIIAGACGSVTNVGALTVNPPTAVVPLLNQTLCYGQTAIFSTVASGTGPFTYSWKKNGVPLEGKNGQSITLSRIKASDAGTYSVEVTGSCGTDSSSAQLVIESDGLVSPAVFANPAPIAMPDFNVANPYPSAIEVSCVPAPLTGVTVTLTNLTHTYAADIDVLLVSPSGNAVMLMSDCGGANSVNNAVLTFTDSAPGSLPQYAAINSGLYKPTDYAPDDNMPVPAPLGPYAAELAAFNGTDANGTWSLYVVDDALMDIGAISGGWSLTLTWGSAVTPARLSPPTFIEGGVGQIVVQAQSGQTCIIEASTNLMNWVPIATNTLNSSIWNYVDSRSTNFTQRFYRAVSRP